MNENEKALTVGFTGGAFANFFRQLAVSFVTLISLGFAGPAMTCWYLRWECEHTYYDGKQLVFDGKAGQYFGLQLKIALLSIITLGIYLLVRGRIEIIKWTISHTHFVGEEASESTFDGKWYQLFGVNWLASFVTGITLGFGVFWAHCYLNRWSCDHTAISGHKLAFDGTGKKYFGACIKWILLTIITLGIYSFWKAVKQKDWDCKHTHIA